MIVTCRSAEPSVALAILICAPDICLISFILLPCLPIMQPISWSGTKTEISATDRGKNHFTAICSIDQNRVYERLLSIKQKNFHNAVWKESLASSTGATVPTSLNQVFCCYMGRYQKSIRSFSCPLQHKMTACCSADEYKAQPSPSPPLRAASPAHLWAGQTLLCSHPALHSSSHASSPKAHWDAWACPPLLKSVGFTTEHLQIEAGIEKD